MKNIGKEWVLVLNWAIFKQKLEGAGSTARVGLVEVHSLGFEPLHRPSVGTLPTWRIAAPVRRAWWLRGSEPRVSNLK